MREKLKDIIIVNCKEVSRERGPRERGRRRKCGSVCEVMQ